MIKRWIIELVANNIRVQGLIYKALHHKGGWPPPPNKVSRPAPPKRPAILVD